MPLKTGIVHAVAVVPGTRRQRQHRPKHKAIITRREFDTASPKLLDALVTSEAFEIAMLSLTGSSYGKPAVASTQ